MMNKYYSDRIKYLKELNEVDAGKVESLEKLQLEYNVCFYDHHIYKIKNNIEEREARIDELTRACKAIEAGKYSDKYYDESDYIMIIRDGGTLRGYNF